MSPGATARAPPAAAASAGGAVNCSTAAPPAFSSCPAVTWGIAAGERVLLPAGLAAPPGEPVNVIGAGSSCSWAPGGGSAEVAVCPEAGPRLRRLAGARPVALPAPGSLAGKAGPSAPNAAQTVGDCRRPDPLSVAALTTPPCTQPDIGVAALQHQGPWI